MFTVSKVLRRLISPKCTSKMACLTSAHRLQNLKMGLHTNTILCVKMYKELENSYAYNLLQANGYTISFDTVKDETTVNKDQFEQLLKKDWSKLKAQQLFEIFSLLGAYCSTHGLCISNTIFDDFIDNFTDSIKYASDEELKNIFFSLVKWPETESIKTRNYIEVWAALDDECLKRLKDWDIDELLKFVSLFFMVNVTRQSDFSLKCINKLASKAKNLSPAQLVQTLFYVGVLRKQPFDMHNLEVHMTNQFQKISIDDIAIMCMGFFKSKTPIRSMSLVTLIINKIIENASTIHEVSLAAILKIIRYSVKIHTDDKIYRLLDAFQHEVPRLSVMCNVHLALLGTSTLTLHKDCLTKIAERVIDSIPNARTKDLERLVLTYGTLNYVPPLKAKECFFEKIVDEFRKPERKTEIEKYGRSFACCIGYLGMLDIYPIDLMDKALSPDFLNNTYGKHCYAYGREILTIHNNSLIFCSETKMNRLSDKVATIMAKKYTDFIPNEDFKKQYNVTERMFLEVFKTLCHSRGGDEFVKGDHVLPHHQRGDIIICNNYNGEPLPVADKLSKPFGLIKQAPDENYWIAVVIAGRNSLINGTDTPSGPFQAKLNQLRAIGYHGVLVPWSVYSTLKTRIELCDYLNKLIKSSI